MTLALPLASRVMKDPGTHFWVKETYKGALMRDPVDAYEDAKLLMAMLREHMDAVTATAKGG